MITRLLVVSLVLLPAIARADWIGFDAVIDLTVRVTGWFVDDNGDTPVDETFHLTGSGSVEADSIDIPGYGEFQTYRKVDFTAAADGLQASGYIFNFLDPVIPSGPAYEGFGFSSPLGHFSFAGRGGDGVGFVSTAGTYFSGDSGLALDHEFSRHFPDGFSGYVTFDGVAAEASVVTPEPGATVLLAVGLVLTAVRRLRAA
jgi:hypothetical protein